MKSVSSISENFLKVEKMKKQIVTLVAGMILVSMCTVSAQHKLVINDKAQLFTESVESMLSERLRADSVELTSMIDTRSRCDYWYATLVRSGNDLQLSVTDCNDRSAGGRNLGSGIMKAIDSEKALLLYYAISDILKKPYGNGAETTPSAAPIELPSPEVLTLNHETVVPENDTGQHRSRYLFAPSSHNLEKGELYYNTLYFLVHDVQYGISDQFSMGMGTSIIGFPFYVTPKLTLPVNPKSAFAIGDMLIIGTWATSFTGNLLYLTYTRGDAYNNFTIGGGYLAVGGQDISNKIKAPVLNFSALARVSSHIYFITESYATFVKTTHYASYYDYNTNIYYEEEFGQDNFLMYSFFGFRFINKNIDVRCWQLGLSFVIAAFGEIPVQYQNSSYYSTDANTGNQVIPIPMIGYARKFSTRY